MIAPFFIIYPVYCVSTVSLPSSKPLDHCGGFSFSGRYLCLMPVFIYDIILMYVFFCTCWMSQLMFFSLQCSNGHVACCSCWSKLDHKCYLCSREISFSRNLALEKIIESIKISCCHAKYGCRRTINYTQRDHHEETCIYAPCYCPVSDCTFSGSTVMLSAHFSSKHSKSSKRFCYGQPFKVNLKPTEPFFVLQGADGHLFLLLNNRDAAMGYALSIACIRPDTPECNFSYELTATGKESSVLLKASTTNIKEWKGVHPTKAFLLVPHDFFYSSGIMLLDVCIQKSNLVL